MSSNARAMCRYGRVFFAGLGVCAVLSVPTFAGTIVPQARVGEPVAGLTVDQLARWTQGRLDYDHVFTVPEGLGPIFNKNSCGTCHDNPLGGPGNQQVTRFGTDGKEKEGSFDPLDTLGGSLLQSESISPECQEVIPDEATITTFRVTNGSQGYGLIEAIPDADIGANETTPPPGVSGRVHWVPAFEDAMGAPLRAGRFGWKAQVPTILTFSADAAQNEIGLTNRFVMTDNDPNGINPPDLASCDTIADPEDAVADSNGRFFIDRVTDFQRFLTSPPQTPQSGMTGETVFNAIGCNACHVKSFTTSDDAGLEDALRNKTIKPYSDFLLHDMGLGGDGIFQGAATDRELRTPVLWGVRTRDPMWHDGRFGAGTFESRVRYSITEHGLFGSESIGVVAAWNSLTPGEQDALLQFLDSLGRAEFDADGNDVIELDDFVDFAACAGGGPYTADDACAVHDIDQDGDVDTDDLASFLLAFDGTPPDCDDSGVDDFTEIVTGVLIDSDGDGIPDVCNCPTDLNGDGQVGFSDLLDVLSAWGSCAACPEDIDADGNVGFLDLLEVLSAWGPCS